MLPSAVVHNGKGLRLLDCLSGTYAGAGSSVDAGISIDYICAVSLADCFYRTLACAGSAGYALICNDICHD